MNVWMLDPSAMTPYYDLDLAVALRARGVRVRLLTSRFIYEDRIPRGDAESEYFFFRPLEAQATRLRAQPRLRRLARAAVYPIDLLRLQREFNRAPPDVLHVQWTLLPSYDWRLFQSFAQRVPLVLTIHDPAVRLQQVARLADMQPMSLIADRVIVHTERNRAMLLERAQIPPERLAVVGIGTPEQPKNPPTQAEARARLGIPKSARVVLFFGLIKVYKGLMTLIDAMAAVHARVPDAHLLIAGQSEEPLAPYVDALSARGLTEAATTSFGFVPSDAVANYFAASDVVCLPYREASQSAVLFDAYRYSKPVVVTRVGGLPEVVEEGGNGFVVPPDNAPALAEALTRLLADPTLFAQFGRRSLELAQTRYSWAQSAEQTERVYRDAIEAFKARS